MSPKSKTLTDAQIISALKTDHPEWAQWILDFPELKKTIIAWAKIPGGPTEEQINKAVFPTKIVQQYNQTQQRIARIKSLAPGEYKSELADVKTQIDAYIKQKGIIVDPASYEQAVKKIFEMGLDIQDPRVTPLLTAKYKYVAPDTDPNAVPVVTDVSRSLSSFAQTAAKYGIPVPTDPAKMSEFVKNAIGPDGTIESFTEYAKNQAKLMYSFMSSAIDSGATVTGYLQPWATQIANTLDILPSSINWQDSKWQSLIAKPDPSKPGMTNPQTMNDVMTTIKTDPQYGYDNTTTAKNDAYGLAARFKSTFGKGNG